MRLIDADSLDETITRLNEQDWEITRNEYTLIDRVIFEMPTIDVLDKIRAEIEETIESYVCDKEENTMKAQGMLNAMQMTFEIIDKYRKGEQEC